MILTDAQRTALRDRIAQLNVAGWSDAQVAEAVNAPVTTTTTATVPRPFTRQQVLALLSDASKGNVMRLPISPKIIDALNAGDRQAVGEYASSLKGSSDITAEEFAAIVGVLVATDQVASTAHGPSIFQQLAGVGDVPIAVGGVTFVGNCTPEMVAEARS